jgi:hydrogenase maturation protease
MTTLIVGLGRLDRGDDGVGPAVVAGLALDDRLDVESMLLDDPTALIDLWTGRELVIVVDAVSSGSPPGTIHTIDATTGPLPQRPWAASGSHAFGLGAAVELARVLGRLPDHLLLVGIEVETTDHGQALSPAVAAAVEPAATAVSEVLDQRR